MDIFESAIEQQKQNNRNSYMDTNNKYDIFNNSDQFIGLPEDKDLAVRLIGNTLELRTESWHPNITCYSSIVHDNMKSKEKIYWPCYLNHNGAPIIDDSWILYRLYNEITEHTKNIDGDQLYTFYHHENTPMFKRVYENKLPKSETGTNFFPSIRVLFNAINRHDYQWHKDNKKFRVLMSRCELFRPENSIKGRKPKYTITIGLPYKTMYEQLLENVLFKLEQPKGDWNNSDVVISRYDRFNYTVTHIFDETISEDAKKYGTDRPLTEEELSWQKENLDELYPHTSYLKLYDTLGELFKDWDSYANTHYYEELQDYVELERKEEAEKNKRKDEIFNKPSYKKLEIIDATIIPEDNIAQKKSNAKIRKPPERKPVEAKPKKSKRKKPPKIKNIIVPNNVGNIFYNYLPQWESLSSYEKTEYMKACQGFKDRGIAVFDRNNFTLYPCENPKCFYPDSKIQVETPSTVLKCPVCGIRYSRAS